ncbi:MAG: hypothetical protein JST04_03685 [Bdellovibrionales bacterium]|nr:hypothetical protein [Bdellovibrionales bacterium]
MSEVEQPLHTLEYRRWFKSLTWFHMAFCTFFAGVFLYAVHGSVFAPTPEMRTGFLGSILMIGMLLGLHLVFFFKFFHPRATSKFHVYADRLEVETGKRRRIAPYSEILKVYGQVLPVIGGNFGFILKSGEVFGFTTGLRDGALILDALVAHSPERREGLAELRAALIVRDHATDRTGEFFRGGRGLFTCLNLFVVPVVFAAYLVGRQGHSFSVPDPRSLVGHTTYGISLAVYSLVFFFVVTLNGILDFPIQERLVEEFSRGGREKPESRARNLEFEKSMLRDALPIYLFALATILGAYNRFDLNLLSVTQVTAEAPHLGLSPGQLLWIDERANRVGGPHSLHEGDKVIFQKSEVVYLGKLVGVPGAVAKLSEPGEPGRKPASSEVTVEPGKIAVRSNPEGDRTEIVDQTAVRGRAVENLRDFIYSRE